VFHDRKAAACWLGFLLVASCASGGCGPSPKALVAPTFHARSSPDDGSFPYGFAAADFNLDGRLDLVTPYTLPGYNAGSGVSVLLGNGDGTFGPPANQLEGIDPIYHLGAVADFNQDGRPDVVMIDLGNYGVVPTLNVLIGNGDGSFKAPIIYTASPAKYANKDGKLDLALVCATSSNPLGCTLGNYTSLGNTIGVSFGNGDGTFQSPLMVSLGSGPDAAPQQLIAGDFNDDGSLDLASANAGSRDVTILLGNGDGSFQGAVRYPIWIQPAGQIPMLHNGPERLTAADFNGDGILDVATANGPPCNRDPRCPPGGIVGDDVSILLGNGDGTFQSPIQYPVEDPQEILTGDFNSDGKPDLCTQDQIGSQVSVLING
jgi:hypothetical protein